MNKRIATFIYADCIYVVLFVLLVDYYYYYCCCCF